MLEASIGYRYGAVLLIDDDGERLEPFALSDQGLGGAFVETDKAYVSSRGIRVGHGITGWVARHGMAVRAGNVLEDPRYVPMRDDIRSELCVPIRVGERILGVINIETTEPDAYSEVDQQTLEIVAAQIGLALEMRRLAGVDSLTGAANRRVFDEALPRELRRGARDNRPVSLLMIDIDHFKDYNDACGHLGGDRCLQDVVAVLARGVSRAGEVLARYGGEEFAVILPDTDITGALQVAEGMRSAVENLRITHRYSQDGGVVTVSIGVASVIPGRTEGRPADLLKAADDALYQAKESGRNRIAATAVRIPP